MPPRNCLAIAKLPDVVILSGAKDLAVSIRSKPEILRLTPQNDIATWYRRERIKSEGANIG
jgi:hypothetical protein